MELVTVLTILNYFDIFFLSNVDMRKKNCIISNNINDYVSRFQNKNRK